MQERVQSALSRIQRAFNYSTSSESWIKKKWIPAGSFQSFFPGRRAFWFLEVGCFHAALGNYWSHVFFFFSHFYQAPRMEAQTVLGSLVCFPNLYLQIPVLQHVPGSEEILVGNEDIKVKVAMCCQLHTALLQSLNICYTRTFWITLTEMEMITVISITMVLTRCAENEDVISPSLVFK